MEEKQKIIRIIDANINRAAEGLRVVEEIFRFILEDDDLTLRVKVLRGRLRKAAGLISRDKFTFRERNTAGDIGKDLFARHEKKRGKVLDIYLANIKRTQEALRVLEEFSKLASAGCADVFKGMRFEVYDIEKNGYYKLLRRAKLDFNLYVITDPMADYQKTVKEAVSAGVKIVQLRDKKASTAELVKWSRKLQKSTKPRGVTFIVNDNLKAAKLSDADGVHLGQEELKRCSIRSARKYLGEEKIIGVSVPSVRSALIAQKEGADYIAVGPIYKTPIKSSEKAVGIKTLKDILAKIKVPVVAIGGIDLSNVDRLIKAGCNKVAAIRAILGGQKIRHAVAAFRKKLEGASP